MARKKRKKSKKIRLKKPLVVINFKTYKQGNAALKLAKSIEKVDKKIIVGVQASEIQNISRNTKLKVFSQHVDYFLPGRYTGFLIPEEIKKSGAKGTFLNHSEHKISFETLKKTVLRCKDINLKTLVFASNLKEAKKIKKLKPDFIVIEPPELVASKTSVSEAKPHLISKIAKKLKAPFLVGAGIHSNNDVKVAMSLGSQGIAVSSAITKSRYPGRVLRNLIKIK